MTFCVSVIVPAGCDSWKKLFNQNLNFCELILFAEILQIHCTGSWNSKTLKEIKYYKCTLFVEKAMTRLIYFPIRLCSSTSLLYHSRKRSSTSIVPKIIKEDLNWTRLFTLLLLENQSILTSFLTPHNHTKTRTLPSKLQRVKRTSKVVLRACSTIVFRRIFLIHLFRGNPNRHVAAVICIKQKFAEHAQKNCLSAAIIGNCRLFQYDRLFQKHHLRFNNSQATWLNQIWTLCFTCEFSSCTYP